MFQDAVHMHKPKSRFFLYVADENGIIRMILSTFDDGETMAVYAPQSTMITVMRNEVLKEALFTRVKRMNIPLKRWKQFSRKMELVMDQASKIQQGNEMSVQEHLGGGLYVTMSSDHPFMQFRQFFRVKDTGELQPGNGGIRVTFDELEELVVHLSPFNKSIPKLDEITLCYEQAGHDPVKCHECNIK